MQRSYLSQPLFLLLLAIIFLSACSKSGSNPAPQNTTPAPVITSLSNTEGDYNATITITGTNFSSAVADNQVFFNGKAATVTAATATQLTVTVPQDAGTGNVTVKVGANTTSGPAFTYLGVLAVSSLSINHGPYTTSVIITGTGFSLTPAKNQIFFNGKAATITAATSTQLTTTVPLSAGTGNVSVSVDNGSQLTGPAFTYELSYVVSTFAGSNLVGVVNGTGSAAILISPSDIASDASDNLYIVEPSSFLVRKVTPAAVVSSYAGTAGVSSNNGTVAKDTFSYPESIAVDVSGNVYVGDGVKMQIKKITPAGVTTIIAGSGRIGSDNGLGNAATFDNPVGLAVDALGNIYVADLINNLIRKITPAGLVTTLAGSGQIGSANGTGTLASFSGPTGVAVDAGGNVYVADYGNNCIRKITPSGVVSNFTAAVFKSPTALKIDATGNVYVADSGDELIKKITPAGVVSTIAGGAQTNRLQIDGIGTQANFYSPTGIAIDSHNNLYVTDGNEIRKIAFE